MHNLDEFILDIIRREGGYVNNPKDRGGPTKFGITLANYKAWTQHQNATAVDVERLTQADAMKFYRWYFADRGIIDLPTELLPLALDLCTLHSPKGVAIILDRVANSYDTTRPRGEVFQSLVNEFGPRTTEGLITLSRIAYFREICTRNPDQKVFLLGWLNRCKEFEPWG